MDGGAQRSKSTDSSGNPRIRFREVDVFNKYSDVFVKYLRANGDRLINSFLVAYPEYQEHFKFAKKLDFDRLMLSPMMRAHNKRVICVMCSLFDNIDYLYGLTRAVKINALRHHKLAVPLEGFERLRLALIAAMNQDLAGTMPQEAIDVMVMAVKNIFSKFEKAGKDLGQKEYPVVSRFSLSN